MAETEYPVGEVITDPDAVLSMLSGRFYDGHLSIVCPVCESEYSHIRNVYTRPGSDPYEGGRAYGGTRIAGPVLAERRDALVIVVEGECPHNWEFRIQQHKGVNLLRFVRLPDSPEPR